VSDPLFRYPPQWIADQTPPDEERRLLRELAATLRDVTALAVDTIAPAEQLADLLSAARDLRDRLAALPSGRMRAGYGQAPSHPSERTFLDTSPVIGLANPLAPPLRLWLDGEAVHGEAIFGGAYEGPPGYVHGGWLAAAFDDVLGATQSATDRPGMTAGLRVRFRRPVPLHRPIHFRGRLVRVEGRRIYASATAHVEDTRCAEADGLFISVDFAAMQRNMRANDAPTPAET